MNADPASQAILDKILNGTYTLTDAIRRIKAVRQFILNQVFASAIGQFTAANEVDTAWLSSLGADFYAQFTPQNVYTLMDNAERELNKIPVLNIYLPFEIPQGEIVRVGGKLRTDYGKNFLVDFKIDPNLIAGCALVWNSVYKDYSVRQRIEDNRPAIINIIRGYLR